MECHCFPRDRTGRRSSGQWGKEPGRRTHRTFESSDGGTGICTTANRPSRGSSPPTAAACPEGHYWHGRSLGSNAAMHTSHNDDRVYLRYTYNPTGQTGALCVNPKTTAVFNSDFTVTGIMIQTASGCP